MTRVIVYSVAFAASVAATVMTIYTNFAPNWISWDVANPGGPHITKTIGLHRSCSSVNNKCQHFPEVDDCFTDRYFCSMWRSVGFMMSFAAVLELVMLVAYAVVLLGGKQKRETGWRVLAFMLMVVGIMQCASMSIVAYLFDNDDRFFVGWKLDRSWVLCTVSWVISVLSAVFIMLSAFVFPAENGYELIPSERHGR